jgi:hypothetical protein
MTIYTLISVVVTPTFPSDSLGQLKLKIGHDRTQVRLGKGVGQIFWLRAAGTTNSRHQQTVRRGMLGVVA